jgi:hypothetical protein
MVVCRLYVGGMYVGGTYVEYLGTLGQERGGG